MDSVFIDQLTVDTVIGVYDWERTIPQRLLLDLEMAWDIRLAAAGDDLQHTLDYAAVSQHVLAFAERNSFELVETFAERLAGELMQAFNIPWLRIRLTKPGAVPQACGVGVEIVRGCR